METTDCLGTRSASVQLDLPEVPDDLCRGAKPSVKNRSFFSETTFLLQHDDLIVL